MLHTFIFWNEIELDEKFWFCGWKTAKTIFKRHTLDSNHVSRVDLCIYLCFYLIFLHYNSECFSISVCFEMLFLGTTVSLLKDMKKGGN